PFERYVRCRTLSPYAIWRFNQKCRSMPAGKTLRIETLAPAVVHWSADSWRAVHDSPTRSTGLGVHLVDLPTTSLPAGAQVLFTF
ncbi:MAG: glucan 1,4-alpha-glucosidase, partial [Chloroflexota bacterium]